MEDIKDTYLISVIKQMEYYRSLGEKAIAQLSDDQLSIQLNQESNSIGTIVKHMWGNMMSRWTDFLNTDGEKEWRKREEEFDNDLTDRETILRHWDEGWTCCFNALKSLKPEDLQRIIYIRNEGHTVSESINRQLAHYPYHVGQIVFLAKALAANGWESLSIPRGGTKTFNDEKFARDKGRRHFTDEK